MDGARSVRHVRYYLRRPPRSPPNSHLERLRQLPAAKRLPPARRRRTRKFQNRHARRRVVAPRKIKMKYRALGRTGFNVSEVSFGAWAIGGTWGEVDDATSLAALNKSIDS